MSKAAVQPDTARAKSPTATAPALGHRVAHGLFWMIAKTLGTKGINLGGQIALAWLLVPQDFGLIGLAYTVTAFISTLQSAGLREILIHRQSQFRRWANPVFWLSACLGVAGMILTLAAIPLATTLYHNAPSQELAGLLAILSIRALLGSLTVVPQSKLSNALRFRALAVIGVITTACNITLACLLAWAGWGAYAIAIGTVASSVVGLMLLWKIAPHPIRLTMQVRRWRFMMGDSVAIVLTGILLTVIGQGDYMALGIFHTAAVTGLYFFAFNLSMQAVTLFTSNLGNVLFPALSKLQDEPRRQTQAFLKAARLLALVVVPACLFQAAIADPMIRLLFPAKWYDAIPVMQILCIGMAFRAVGAPGGALMQGQGRFRSLMVLYAVLGTLYFAAVMIAAAVGGIVVVAIVEASFFVVWGTVQCRLGINPGGGRWGDIVLMYVPAMTGTVLALIPGFVLAESIPAIPGRNLARIAAVVLIGIPLYVLIMSRLARRDGRELWVRIKGMFMRLRTGSTRVPV